MGCTEWPPVKNPPCGGIGSPKLPVALSKPDSIPEGVCLVYRGKTLLYRAEQAKNRAVQGLFRRLCRVADIFGSVYGEKLGAVLAKKNRHVEKSGSIAMAMIAIGKGAGGWRGQPGGMPVGQQENDIPCVRDILVAAYTPRI